MNAIVYSTEVCPFCIQAKRLLSLKGIKYKETLVVKDEKADGELSAGQILKSELQKQIQEITGDVIETVPQIFLEGQYIGGFTDLVAHFNKERDEHFAKTLKDIEVELSE